MLDPAAALEAVLLDPLRSELRLRLAQRDTERTAAMALARGIVDIVFAFKVRRFKDGPPSAVATV